MTWTNVGQLLQFSLVLLLLAGAVLVWADDQPNQGASGSTVRTSSPKYSMIN